MSGSRVPYNDYRLSIIPGRAVTDERLERGDIVVLALLGRHTKRNGWCLRSQVVMAEELRCGRGTIQRSLDRLESAGYIEKRANGRGRREAPAIKEGEQPFAPYSYRVLFDRDDEAVEGAHGWAGGVPTEAVEGAHGWAGGVPTEDGQGVPAQDGQGVPTLRAPLKKVVTEGSKHNDTRARDDAVENSDHPEWSKKLAALGDALIAIAKAAGKAKSKSPYTCGFERVWTEFRKWPDNNGSKFEAWQAYQALKDVRPSDGDLVVAVRAEARWMAEQSQKRRPNDPYPPPHPSTWLRRRGWEKHLEAIAEQTLHREAIANPRRITLAPEHVEALRNAGIGEAVLATWFADGEYREARASAFAKQRTGTFFAATPMKRNWIASHYGQQLAKAFGTAVTIKIRQEAA